MFKRFSTVAAVVAMSAVAAPAANAGVVVNVTQQGSDVVAQASGFLDLAQLNLIGSTVGGPYKHMKGSTALVSIGNSGNINIYDGFTGPSSFGTTTQIDSLTGTGLGFTFVGSTGRLSLGETYVSNTAITSSATWTNKTIASLGLTSGQYDYSYNGQMISISIGSSLETPVYVPPSVGGIPEAGTWAMLILGMGLVGGVMRKRATRTAIRFV